MMKKVAIYVKENDLCKKIEENVSKLLVDAGISLDNKNPDIVIIIGGDGTFLRAVHHYLDRVNELLFIGINAGHLGFFSEFNIDEVKELVRVIKEDDYKIEKHSLLKTFINQDEEKNIFAVNEIRIENPFHTLISEVIINDEKLETFRGNGLVVCSTLGSSAYNKSLGGSVLDSSLDLLEITEIAAIQNNVFRSLGSSIVLSGDKKIELVGDFKDVVVGYDFETFHLNKATSLCISLSNKRLSLIRRNSSNQVAKLRESFIE